MKREQLETIENMITVMFPLNTKIQNEDSFMMTANTNEQHSRLYSQILFQVINHGPFMTFRKENNREQLIFHRYSTS